MSKNCFVSLAFAASLVFAGPALAQSRANTITMPVDAVRVITFPVPVKTVYVGNPMIADVTVIDARHVFLQAKSLGATNVLALNNSGLQISNQRVAVFSDATDVVTLQRGPARTTLSCAGSRCEVQPTPGDDKAAYEVAAQVTQHQAQLRAAATGGR